MSSKKQAIDPFESLTVSEDPRRVVIRGEVIPENLGGNAFRLLKFLADHKGGWFSTDRLTNVVWGDSPPVNPATGLAAAKKAINDTLQPYVDGHLALDSWPFRGYRLKATAPEKHTELTWFERIVRWLQRRLEWIGTVIPQFFVRSWRWSLATAVVILIFESWLLGLDQLLFPRSVDIAIASSSTKQEWMDEVVARFNEASSNERALQLKRTQLQIWGRPVHVEVILEEVLPNDWRHYRSGTMITDILSGKIQPTIASPAETVWIDMLEQDWPSSRAREHSGGSASIMSEAAEPLTYTPFVIAMWESRAEAMDCWPEASENCTWKAIVEMAPEGWSAKERPEWGSLKFGYALPGRSNSATFTAVFACLSGIDAIDIALQRDLTMNENCEQAIRKLEEAEIIRATSSSEIMRRLREAGGPGTIDMVPTYEAEVVELNAFLGATLDDPIVAAYPQDGTSVPTHPFGLLDEAPWVSGSEAKAAEVFEAFLREKPQVEALVRHGIRPADASAVGPPIDTEHGAQPDANIVSLDVPLDAIDQVVDVWNRVVKPR